MLCGEKERRRVSFVRKIKMNPTAYIAWWQLAHLHHTLNSCWMPSRPDRFLLFNNKIIKCSHSTNERKVHISCIETTLRGTLGLLLLWTWQCLIYIQSNAMSNILNIKLVEIESSIRCYLKINYIKLSRYLKLLNLYEFHINQRLRVYLIWRKVFFVKKFICLYNTYTNKKLWYHFYNS